MSKIQLEAVERHLVAADMLVAGAADNLADAADRMNSALATTRIMLAALDAPVEPTPDPEPTPEPEPEPAPEPVPTPDPIPDPAPTPVPVPTPPVTGTYKAFDAAELDAKARAAAPGETIVLAGSEYGAFKFDGVVPSAPITVISERPRSAHFQSIGFGRASNIHLRDLSVWTDAADTSVTVKKYAITSYAANPGIVLDGILFRAAPDSDDYPEWDKARWLSELLGGALLGGANSAIRNCRAIGVRFGFGIGGVDSEMVGNQVEGFTGDAFRPTNSRQRVVGNFCGDAFQIDTNHSDAVQAFLTGGTLSDLTVEDNILMEWVTDPKNPLRAKMQGISLWNGPYANAVIRNNQVTTTSANGIAANATADLTIDGNRLQSADGLAGDARWPWVRVMNPSGALIVTNNEAAQFTGIASAQQSSGNIKPDYAAPIKRPAPIW